MSANNLPEPWLRGTLTDVPAVQRAVLHALELAAEDIRRWCDALTDEQLNARPAGIAPVAFHVRHIARSIDRLLTYAEGCSLTEQQLTALRSELDPGAQHETLFVEFDGAMAQAAERIRAFDPKQYGESRTVGRQLRPTTVGGLLVHIADHTQRHVGQAITTTKVVKAAAQ